MFVSTGVVVFLGCVDGSEDDLCGVWQWLFEFEFSFFGDIQILHSTFLLSFRFCCLITFGFHGFYLNNIFKTA